MNDPIWLRPRGRKFMWHRREFTKGRRLHCGKMLPRGPYDTIAERFLKNSDDWQLRCGICAFATDNAREEK